MLNEQRCNNICIPESFNTNISHQPFYNKITFVNSQRENEKKNCSQKPVLNVRFKDFWFTKIKFNKNIYFLSVFLISLKSLNYCKTLK